MLLRNPKEFERMAKEWAVIHAGAPKRQLGESSGGATEESMRLQELKAKEEEERDQLAAYDILFLSFVSFFLSHEATFH
jgi:ubiquitin-conjugating enzyme (huntingtin interacting protein 2)